MPRRTLSVAFILMAMASSWQAPEALAGPIAYTWGPVSGYGYYVSYPSDQLIPFQTGDGSFTIFYDPDNLPASSIGISSGSPGYGLSAAEDFSVQVDPGRVVFSAEDAFANTHITISVAGDPGPRNSWGLPVSLDSLLTDPATGGGSGGFHGYVSFEGQTVPEPSGLVLGAVGLACCAAWTILRRARGDVAPPRR